jgi:hypothetical protein
MIRRRSRTRLAMIAAAGALAISGLARAGSAPLWLWRLDCGTVEVPDAGFLSDTFALAGQARTVTDSCYLIRHGDRYLLWDTGLPLSRLGAGRISVGGGMARLKRSLVDQLADLKLTPDAIGIMRARRPASPRRP